MRKKSKRMVQLPDGAAVKISRLRKNIGNAPNLAPVVNRLRAVWLAQYLLAAQRTLYEGLGSFSPLIESIDQFHNAVDACEDQLLLAAWDMIDPVILKRHIQEIVGDMDEAISSPSFSIEADSDLEDYGERAWQGIARLSPWLQDAVRGVHDSGQPDLYRLSEFDAAVEKRLRTTEESGSGPQTFSFHGDAWVEDDAFICQVERLIVTDSLASIQLSGIDESGRHTAEGSFELKNGIWHTRRFSVRYERDTTDEPARFHLSVLELARDGQSARLEAEWIQDGNTFPLEADLEAFRASS